MSGPLPPGTRMRALPPFDTPSEADDLVIAAIQFVDADGGISESATDRWQYLVERFGDAELVAFAPQYVEPV